VSFAPTLAEPDAYGVPASARLAICLVTTSPDLSGSFTQGINAIEGLRVSSVMDATTDLTAALRRDEPDVVVLDQGTCFPLLEKIMRTGIRMPRRPHVVVLTARTRSSEREELLSSGVDFVFTKLRPMRELGLLLRRLGRAGLVPDRRGEPESLPTK
jgi:DNA-binding response OmpR family regulator